MERKQVELKKGEVALIRERLKMATADLDRLNFLTVVLYLPPQDSSL